MGRLTNVKVKSLTTVGLHGDGQGLYLRVGRTGSRAWIQRITTGGRRSDIGLGAWPAVGLAEARVKAALNKKMVAEGRDLLAEKKAQQRQVALPTFKQAAVRFYAENVPRWKAGRHTATWLRVLEQYAFPKFGHIAIDHVDRHAVLQVLTPIWTTKPAQARRLRQCLRIVFRWCQAHGFCEINPAGEVIDGALPSMVRVTRHMPALPYQQLPEVLATIAQSHGPGATVLCLRFLACTAVRGAEARHAAWSEINWERRTWTIPASHMKTGREHRVPLSDAALGVLEQAKRLDQGAGLIFPGRRGQPLSFITLSKFCRDSQLGFVPHGLRSSFRDWCGETGKPRELAEAALAHTVGGVEGAYFRSDLFDRRRALMQAWGHYLTGHGQADVVQLHA